MKTKRLGLIILASLLVALGVLLIGVSMFNWALQFRWLTLITGAAALASLVHHGPRFWNLYMLLFSAAGFAAWGRFFADGNSLRSLAALALLSTGLWLLIHILRSINQNQASMRRQIGDALMACGLTLVGAAMLGDLFVAWLGLQHVLWPALIFVFALSSMINYGPRFWNLYTGLLAVVFLANSLSSHLLIDSFRVFFTVVAALGLISLGATLALKTLRNTPCEQEERRSRFWSGMILAAFIMMMFGQHAAAWYRSIWSVSSGWDFLAGMAAVALGIFIIVKYLRLVNRQSIALPGDKETPICFALFSSETYQSTCQTLQGGQLRALFGGVTVDLSQANFDQHIAIETFALFGGVTIIPPPHVYAVVSGTSFLGGSTNLTLLRPYDPAHPPFTVKYVNIFGTTKIK